MEQEQLQLRPLPNKDDLDQWILRNRCNVKYPRFEINFGGKNKDKESEIIEVSEFIGVKSYKAKGKRLTKFNIKNVIELEAIVKDEDVKEHFEEPEFEIIRKDTDNDDTSQMTLDL